MWKEKSKFAKIGESTLGRAKLSNENYPQNMVHGMRSKKTSSFKDIMIANRLADTVPIDHYRKDWARGKVYPSHLPKATNEPDFRFGKTNSSKLKRKHYNEREPS